MSFNPHDVLHERTSWISEFVEQFSVRFPQEDEPTTISAWLARMDDQLRDGDHAHIEFGNYIVSFLGRADYLDRTPVVLHVSDKRDRTQHLFIGESNQDGSIHHYNPIPLAL